MARPLRIEVPDGIYHVTSRGLERRAIVREDAADDRSLLDRAEAVMGRCRRELARHRFGWRLTGASDTGHQAPPMR
jgi:hypothetical protein